MILHFKKYILSFASKLLGQVFQSRKGQVQVQGSIVILLTVGKRNRRVIRVHD